MPDGAGPELVTLDAEDARLAISNLRKVFVGTAGRVVPAIAGISFSVGHGEVIGILGPSGCGKSTLLRILAGLDDDYSGDINWPTTGADAGQRLKSATVFQSDSTLPWMTVEQNVSLGCASLRISSAERARRARHYLDLVGLGDFRAAYPHELSGGMRQRVAIARALATEPSLLLMDEPLAALDAQTRVVIQQELLGIWRQTRSTVIYITHDIAEALTLADRVFVMSRRPGTVVAERMVPFERPRDAIALRRRPVFGLLEAEIWEMLAIEVGQNLTSSPEA